MTRRAWSTSSGGGSPRRVGRSTWLGVDQRLAVEAHLDALAALGGEPVGVVARRCTRRRRSAVPASRAPSTAVARYGVRLARPGTPSGTRSSRARSLVPTTRTPTRGCAARTRTSKIAVGVSIIAQIDVSVAPPASSRAATSSSVVEGVDLGDDDGGRPGVQPRPRGRRSPTPSPVRCSGSSAAAARTPPTSRRRRRGWRASALASGATASSRSKMIASHGIVLAFSSARSLAAGM